MRKYKRVQSVSNMMIDFQSAKLLKYVTNKDEIVVAFNTIIDYFEKARIRDAEEVTIEMPDVSPITIDAITGMIESIDDGITKFWNVARKNQKARNGAEDDGGDNRSTQGDNGSTTGRPIVVLGRPNKSNEKENENEKNENSQYNTVSNDNKIKGYCTKKILESDMADEFKRSLWMMKEHGLEINNSVIESLAYKMDEFGINEQDVKDALNICQRKGKMKIDYFFAVVNHTIEGWNNSAN